MTPFGLPSTYVVLQVLTACLKSFAHGANDTANAAGPFAAVQSLYLNPDTGCQGITTPLWVLAFCGVGIVVVGLAELERVAGHDLSAKAIPCGVGRQSCLQHQSTDCCYHSWMVLASCMASSDPRCTDCNVQVQLTLSAKAVAAYTYSRPVAG